jgi:hypothetical protein
VKGGRAATGGNAIQTRRRVFAGYSVFIETLSKSGQKIRNNRGPDNMDTDALYVGKSNRRARGTFTAS